MRRRSSLFVCVFALLAGSGLAQEGHPLTGTWTGDVAANHVTLAIEWDGKAIAGTINPGPNAAKITGSRIDPAMWSIHLEADGKDRIVIDGGLTDIGSASRVLTGTWTEGATKTPVKLTRVDSNSASSNSGDAPHAIVYDGPRITLRGEVTNVEWINPRVRIAVSVRERGATANWTIELADGATTLEQDGFSARTLKIGDAVVVQGVTATGGESHKALASTVSLARGGAQLFKLSVTTPGAYGPVPRWPDGQPRLAAAPGMKGYWKADVPAGDLATLKTGDAAAMSWARAVLDYRVRNSFKDDPFARCVPPGGPRQFLGPQGFQFVEQRDLGRVLVLLGDGDRNWRIIYTDGRPVAQAADVVASYYGTSSGKWEKDTFVVDSVGYNEKFWFFAGGLPHTEALHLTERFTRTDLSTMKYEVTVDDPRTYTKPWKASYTMRWIAGRELQEFFCEEKTS
ncbi:MAG TPA: DUF6152 family protein [Vicinamibacterales bacterium]|nr:DUF6152 family protein [Vicinamibacterales bacterium]